MLGDATRSARGRQRQGVAGGPDLALRRRAVADRGRAVVAGSDRRAVAARGRAVVAARGRAVVAARGRAVVADGDRRAGGGGRWLAQEASPGAHW